MALALVMAAMAAITSGFASAMGWPLSVRLFGLACLVLGALGALAFGRKR
jgi:hypothetical protein